ncbi:replication protein P [Marinobacterium sp. MBR-109]|jgi:hypothetical protein|uniref:replication protein P n=1 Tax=Marinobacterium sp. MBR-109 TaxID=3156462 RepID=UPI00339733F8
MKTPAGILGKSANGLPQPSWTSRTPTGNDAREQAKAQPISAETKTLVNMIFARFMAIYGHKFKSCFETEDELRIAKREWALSLRGYGESELVAAVNRCKETLAWMPTISEFLALLREISGDHGLPGMRDAYIEACMHAEHPLEHPWSHPAVYHAGRETGWFRLRSEEERQVLPAFSYQYDVMCRRVREGESLEQPVPVAIENKQANTVADFIQRFTAEHDLEPEEGATLLYYLTLPRGSKIRQRMQQQSQQKLDQRAAGITLPDEAH